MQLGAYDNGSGPQFNMTALALRAASGVNAVSQLHGVVTREMWGPIWPGVPEDARPVRAITNGIHMPTWLSNEMAKLFDDHMPADWRDRHDDPDLWARVLDIPDEALWEARNALRQYLFAFIRERARQRWRDEQVSAARVVAAGTLLDPNALTIGFARRFTGYKRPELIFHNPERLQALLNASRRPLQIVFAGKAHPADETGKHHLQQVYRRAIDPAFGGRHIFLTTPTLYSTLPPGADRLRRQGHPADETGKHHLQQVYRRAIDPAFGGRIAFVDDYDLHVAHFLVQGCDVWLNNPRKPLEASGTSGMKASLNGVPHLSIGDGWWAEGYTGDNGWLIDAGDAGDNDAQDAADAARIYDLLEQRDRPDVLRPRQRHPVALAVVRPQRHRQRRAALQRPPHGQGLRREDVRPACSARRRGGHCQPATPSHDNRQPVRCLGLAGSCVLGVGSWEWDDTISPDVP